MQGGGGEGTIIFSLMMTISLHLQLPEVRDNRCVSSACMHTERDDTERFASGMVIYGLNDFIACQMKEKFSLWRALSSSSYSL